MHRTPARILVIEDEPFFALHLHQQLLHLGYEVPGVTRVSINALQQIETLKPDLVLLDIDTAGGTDVIGAAVRIPEQLHVPVVCLTASSEETTIERVLLPQPNAFLLKPCTDRELHMMIQMVLGGDRTNARGRGDPPPAPTVPQASPASPPSTEPQPQRYMVERRNAQRVLQAQRMEAMGQITGGVAHDFNNMMQIVVNNIDILIRTLPEDAAQYRRLAEKAMDNAKRAVTLTQRLLAYTRHQAPPTAVLQINAALSSLSDFLYCALGEHIAVKLVLGAGLPSVEVDPNQLERAIINLAVNARDAMPSGGTLTIETGTVYLERDAGEHSDISPGQYVWLRVTDTGTGMDAATLKRACEPYFTTKDHGKGSGIGLAQVNGFVKHRGGHLRIISAPGAGTIVNIYLPALPSTLLQ